MVRGEGCRSLFRRGSRLLGLAIAGTAIVAIVMVSPVWLASIYRMIIPRRLERTLIDGFLRSVLALYLIGLLASVIGSAALGRRLIRDRRTGRRGPPWVGKFLASALGFLFAAGLLESLAGYGEVAERRPPEPPRRKTGIIEPKGKGPGGRTATGAISIVVLGESSARGEPYDRRFSAGQAIGWQLERIFPGRPVEVDVRARPGVPLERMGRVLFEDVEVAPDAVIIYAGHNEFAARFGWESWTRYYVDDHRTYIRQSISHDLASLTPFSRRILAEADRQWIDAKPPLIVTRELVDRPAYSAPDRAEILDRFGKQLEAMVAYCERIGSLPILIIPSGNDGGFDPTRSYLAPSTEEPDRRAFAFKFKAARALEETDPESAIAAYRALIDSQPGFAESHFRLGILLEAKRDFAGARSEYILAREADGLPMRCPDDFRDEYRKVAARHDVLLVDSQAVLEATSPRGFLDDHLFHDGQHPNFVAYVAIAKAVLDGLAARKAFGWPEGVGVPEIDVDDFGRRTGMTADDWARVCDRSLDFWRKLSFVRFDPLLRLRKMQRWKAALEKIQAGAAPEDCGVPGFGLHPRSWKSASGSKPG